MQRMVDESHAIARSAVLAQIGVDEARRRVAATKKAA